MIDTTGEKMMKRQQFERIREGEHEEWEDSEQQKRVEFRKASGYRIVEIDSDDTVGGPIPFLYEEIEAIMTRLREIELEDKEDIANSQDERIVDCTDGFYRMMGKEYDPKKAFGSRVREKIVRCGSCVYRKEDRTCKLFGTKMFQNGFCCYGKDE